MCTSGCGNCRPAATSRSFSTGRLTTSPSQKSWPVALTASWTLSGLVRFGALAAFGRSIFTACVKSGAVMMKITSSTSITSISGIMLMSAIGAPMPLRWKPPKAMSDSLLGWNWFRHHHGAHVVDMCAGGENGEQVVRECIELRQHDAIGAHERVIGEHRRNRHGETECGHDERFADGAGDLVERSLATHADIEERVVDGPHRTEQTDEWSGAAHRGEDRQPRFEARGFLVYDAPHRPRDELRSTACLRELVVAMTLSMVRSDYPMPRKA